MCPAQKSNKRGHALATTNAHRTVNGGTKNGAGTIGSGGLKSNEDEHTARYSKKYISGLLQY